MEEVAGSWSMSLPPVDMLARLVLASLFGAIVGIDREVRRKPAGLRTHMLVSLAAAALAILSWELYVEVIEKYNQGDPDPLRVMEAVIAGVAFLGAGTIIRGRGEIEGITTGASIWLSGAVGIATGSGYYLLGAATTVIALFILVVMRWFESLISKD